MDNFYQIQHSNRVVKQINKEKFQDNSRKRLVTSLEKKFMTTMVGALAAFEKEFGELWGNGQDIDELTSEQLGRRDSWFNVRSKILDNGHTQTKAAIDELDQYTISWNRYITKFIVKSQ